MTDPEVRARLKAWGEGGDAHDEGATREENPYPEGTQERWAWDLGWEGARRGRA